MKKTSVIFIIILSIICSIGCSRKRKPSPKPEPVKTETTENVGNTEIINVPAEEESSQEISINESEEFTIYGFGKYFDTLDIEGNITKSISDNNYILHLEKSADWKDTVSKGKELLSVDLSLTEEEINSLRNSINKYNNLEELSDTPTDEYYEYREKLYTALSFSMDIKKLILEPDDDFIIYHFNDEYYPMWTWETEPANDIFVCISVYDNKAYITCKSYNTHTLMKGISPINDEQIEKLGKLISELEDMDDDCRLSHTITKDLISAIEKNTEINLDNVSEDAALGLTIASRKIFKLQNSEEYKEVGLKQRREMTETLLNDLQDEGFIKNVAHIPSTDIFTYEDNNGEDVHFVKLLTFFDDEEDVVSRDLSENTMQQ